MCLSSFLWSVKYIDHLQFICGFILPETIATGLTWMVFLMTFGSQAILIKAEWLPRHKT